MTDVAENEVKPSEVPPTIEVNDSIPATPEREDSTTATEDAHRGQVDAIVTAAYLSASKPHAGTSASEDAVAEREETVRAANDAYDKLNSFCNDHPSVFNKVLNVLDSALDPKSLDSTFVEVSKVIITGTNLLIGVHPFLDIVLRPLKLILNFDLMRRQNNKKVTAVKMQILDTATVLFRFRFVREAQVNGPDGRPLQNLADLAKRIATDIQACSSACDLYLDRSNWSKFIRASDYEKIFADYMITFNGHKTTLTLALTAHIAVTAETQSAKIDQQMQHLKSIGARIEELFRLLDTTREREVKRFIDAKGGARACIQSDATLKELADKCGESLESLLPTETTTTQKLVEDARKVLNKELLEDVAQAVKRHMDDFSRKWNAEQNQVKAQIVSSEKHIIAVVEGTSSQRVEDAELRQIWTEQKWKSGVNPRDFVVAVNEHFAFELARRHGVRDTLNVDPQRSAGVSSAGDHPDFERDEGDQWVIGFINLAHLQPLLDIIDTDGSGFINVDEANHFTRTTIRPNGWRLYHWFAFWAAGWHLTVTWYRYNIYNILEAMLTAARHVKPTNLQAADSYLAGRAFQSVELLLRTTRPASSRPEDTQLKILAEEFHKLEEAGVKKQLEQLCYQLDNIDSLQLVTGALGMQGLRRIEVHLYPLLYFLLQRHLAVMQLACVHTLHEDEFTTMSTSLAAVFAEVKHRTDKIKAKFISNARDVEEAFSHFAFGMFEQLHNGDPRERDPINNTIQNSREEEEDGLKDNKYLGPHPDQNGAEAMAFFADIPHQILLNAIPDEPEQLHSSEPPLLPATPTDSEVGTLDGIWKGQIFFPDKAQPYGTISMQLTHRAGDLRGQADNFMGSLDVEGKVEDNNLVQFTLTWPLRFSYSLECKGKYTPWADTIAGLWAPTGSSSTNARSDLRFIFRRPPGFRLTEEQKRAKVGLEVLTKATIDMTAPKDNTMRNPLRRALARRRLMWLADRLVERRRFIDLVKREIADSRALSGPWKPLDAADATELQRLKIDLRPCDAMIYRSLAEFEVRQLVYHGRNCDSCAKNIRGTRRFCIQCIDDKFDNGIDLCSRCSEATPSQGLNFTHRHSHLVVKTTRRIHDGHMGWIVWATKLTAERAKERSRAARTSPSHMEGVPQPDSDVIAYQSEAPQFRCCYCEKPLVRPFWACVECEKDTYVCVDCDAKGSCLADCGTLCVESRQYHASQIKSLSQRHGSPLPQSEGGSHFEAAPQSEGQELVPDPKKYGWLKPQHKPGFCPHAPRLNSYHKLIHPLVFLIDDDDSDDQPQVTSVTLDDVMAKLLEMERKIVAIEEKLNGQIKDD